MIRKVYGKGGIIQDAINAKYDPQKWIIVKEDIAKELGKYADKGVLPKELVVALFDLYSVSTRDQWSIRTMSDMSNYIYDVFCSLEKDEWFNVESGFDPK